jgi:hypothetical protein
MARRRTLRPEEEEIWAAVARTAKPLHPVRPICLKPVIVPAHAVPVAAEFEQPHMSAQPRQPLFRLGDKFSQALPTSWPARLCKWMPRPTAR